MGEKQISPPSYSVGPFVHDGNENANLHYDTMTSYNEIPAYNPQAIPVVMIPLSADLFLDKPVPVKCPFCQTIAQTTIDHQRGCLTWLCCVAISAIGGIFGCCLLPFISKTLQDVRHSCSKCHAVLALYKRL